MNVLIVDDEATNLALFSHMLATTVDATPRLASDPVAALDWCATHEPDLVLLDYMMPTMDGLEFLRRFRALPGKAMTPVVMVTADTESAVRHQALQLSANDFLTKPVNMAELRARVGNLLTLRKAQQELANRATWLADEVRKATAAIAERDREIILRLSRAAEYRDPETGDHLLRMAAYAALTARGLGMGPDECALVRDAAPMHDIGKVGIADSILLKRGRLTSEEVAVMRGHARIGADILEGSSSPLLQVAARIALSHHEKFDGSGYPQGLIGAAIPIYGRITAVADVFDALTSERPYKKAWTLEAAAEHLRAGAGAHFDPDCVRALLADWPAVCAIHQQHHTSPSQPERKAA
ncbi:response regulator [Duganella sp. FT3S]|uniref:Response regulator n=1 Tax=Rugamonas fusca TaxID=2758568 RepID=A0A7W2ED81_9BURK|nr:HD domain-containing phosphohydrolase [Rugamonas fusca]MBA5603764.1 response regulator [Rugamonas fusca]